MTISTHVLDTSIGKPAAAITVHLQRQNGTAWIHVSRGSTDRDGRVSALLPPNSPPGAGGYRLTFEVGEYFEARGVEFLTSEIADTLMRRLHPGGVIVVVECEHLCMSMRGIQKPGARTVTSAVRGILQRDAKTRSEAMSLILAHH